jgi:hypothetical protein
MSPVRLGKAAVFTAALRLLLAPAVAQAASDDAAASRAGEIEHLRKMQGLFPDLGTAEQAAPAVIPALKLDPHPGGVIATFQPNDPTTTGNSPFFVALRLDKFSAINFNTLCAARIRPVGAALMI